MDTAYRQPATRIVAAALRDERDPSVRADLLFLEGWRTGRTGGIAGVLRAGQLRRANPALAAAIERELTGARGG